MTLHLAQDETLSSGDAGTHDSHEENPRTAETTDTDQGQPQLDERRQRELVGALAELVLEDLLRYPDLERGGYKP